MHAWHMASYIILCIYSYVPHASFFLFLIITECLAIAIFPVYEADVQDLVLLIS